MQNPNLRGQIYPVATGGYSVQYRTPENDLICAFERTEADAKLWLALTTAVQKFHRKLHAADAHMRSKLKPLDA